MNNTETELLLRTRRNLTGSTYNDDTIADWRTALEAWTYEQCREALIAASHTGRKVVIADLVEHLPALRTTDDRHSSSCICAGRGWIEIEQHNDHETWWAWGHCPDGPHTEFVEPPDDAPPATGPSPAMTAAVHAAHHRPL